MTDDPVVEAMAQAFNSCTINTPHASMHAALAVARPLIREAALREAAEVCHEEALERKRRFDSNDPNWGDHIAQGHKHITANVLECAILDLLEKPHV